MAYSDYSQNEAIAQIQAYFQLKRAADPDFLKETDLSAVNGDLGDENSLTNQTIRAWLEKEGLAGTVKPGNPDYLQQVYDAVRTSAVKDGLFNRGLDDLAKIATIDPAQMEEQQLALLDERRLLKSRLHNMPSGLSDEEKTRLQTETQETLTDVEQQLKGADRYSELVERYNTDPLLGQMLRAGSALSGLGGSVLTADAGEASRQNLQAVSKIKEQRTAYDATGLQQDELLSEAQMQVGDNALQFLIDNNLLPEGIQLSSDNVNTPQEFLAVQAAVRANKEKIAEKAATMAANPASISQANMMMMQAALGLISPSYAVPLEAAQGNPDFADEGRAWGAPGLDSIRRFVADSGVTIPPPTPAAVATAAEPATIEPAAVEPTPTQPVPPRRTSPPAPAADEPAEQPETEQTTAPTPPATEEEEAAPARPVIDPFTAYYIDNVALNRSDVTIHTQRVWEMLRQQAQPNPGQAIEDYIKQYGDKYKEDNGKPLSADDVKALRESLVQGIVSIRDEQAKYNGIKPTPEQIADTFVENHILSEISPAAKDIYNLMQNEGMDFDQAANAVGGFETGPNGQNPLRDQVKQEIEGIPAARQAIISYESVSLTAADAMQIARQSWAGIPNLPNTVDHYAEMMQAKIDEYRQNGTMDEVTAAARAAVDVRAQMDRDNGVPARAIIDQDNAYYQNDVAQMAEWFRSREYMKQAVADAASRGETLSRVDASRHLDDYDYLLYRREAMGEAVKVAYNEAHPEAAPPAPEASPEAAPGTEQRSEFGPNGEPLTSGAAAQAQLALTQQVLDAAVDAQGVNQIQANAQTFQRIGIDVSSAESLAASMRDPAKQQNLMNLLSMAAIAQQIDASVVSNTKTKLDQFNQLEQQRQSLPQTLPQPQQPAPPPVAETEPAPEPPPPPVELDFGEAVNTNNPFRMTATVPELENGAQIKPQAQNLGQTMAAMSTEGQLTIQQAALAWHTLHDEDPSGTLSEEQTARIEAIAAELGVAPDEGIDINDPRLLQAAAAYANEIPVSQLPAEWNQAFAEIAPRIEKPQSPQNAAPGLVESFEQARQPVAPPPPEHEPAAEPQPGLTDSFEAAHDGQAQPPVPNQQNIKDSTGHGFEKLTTVYYDFLGSMPPAMSLEQMRFQQGLQDRFETAEQKVGGITPELGLRAAYDMASFARDGLRQQEIDFVKNNWDQLQPYFERIGETVGNNDYEKGAEILKARQQDIINETYNHRGAQLRETLQGSSFKAIDRSLEEFSASANEFETIAQNNGIDLNGPAPVEPQVPIAGAGEPSVTQGAPPPEEPSWRNAWGLFN